MSRPGHIWRHVTIGTKNSWLPGDPRGWRSKRHRRHSSGDYRNPPPADEYAAIFHHSRRHSAPKVVIPVDSRQVVGRMILKKLQQYGHRVLAIAVGPVHTHLLAELPRDPASAKRVIGLCKSASSHAVRRLLPGAVWAHQGSYEPIRDHAHQHNTYQYILDHIDEGAWTWSFRDGEKGPISHPDGSATPRHRA
jgi:REP element-mobilizing transposase RayT